MYNKYILEGIYIYIQECTEENNNRERKRSSSNYNLAIANWYYINLDIYLS